MKILSAAEVIALERDVIAKGTSAADLMERAGRETAARIAAAYPQARVALIAAGKGNNAGDGLVVARQLAAANWEVRVVLIEGEKALRDLPREQLKRLRADHPQVLIHSQLHEALFPGANGVVIDALLGVGSTGALRGVLAKAAADVNAARACRFFRTVALDLPTGLPDDAAHAMVADLTITVGFAKDFLVREDLAHNVGRIEAVPLFEMTVAKKDDLLTRPDLAPLLPRRSPLSHKNTYGRVVIVGGSVGFSGASVLAAQAALRLGAGLVNIAAPKAVYPVIAVKAPSEVMVRARTLDKKFAELLNTAQAVAVGPGLGLEADAERTLAFVCKQVTKPMVIDADALTLLAKKPSLLKKGHGPVILTPHPGEMKRLLGREFSLKERPAVARELSRKFNAVVILKGARTVIAAPNEPLAFNSTGNPGMAVGGSGDTLTGVIAALLAQGLAPANAARLGVWLHGRAADLALQARGCEEGLLPTDVSEWLNHAVVALRQG